MSADVETSRGLSRRGTCPPTDRAGSPLLAPRLSCVDGTHSHPLSLVEHLGGRRSAVECTACDREFVQEDDGTLVPVR